MQKNWLLLRLSRIAFVFWMVMAGLGLGAHAQQPAASLDKAACLKCHDGKKSKLETPTASGKPRALRAVAPELHAKSVHATMQCVVCHTGIKDNAEKGAHARSAAEPATKPDCASCHQELWEQAQKDGRAAQRPGLGLVAQNIEAYRKSFHARPNADDKTQPNASCDNCHDTHTFNVPAKNTPEHAQFRLGISDQCGTCHADQLETYRTSVHGQESSSKDKLGKTAGCSDCHTSHDVVNTSGNPFKLAVTASCGNCHTEQFESYKDTFHGKITTLGYVYTAKCYDCHGSHDILRVKDPKSTVHPDNRMETCRTCHNPKKGLPDVPAGFASFLPHGHAHDFDRYPQIWIAFQMMTGLLIGTFGFFWLHTALWFFREYKERRARGGHALVRVDEVAPALRQKHIQRFSPIWRIAHLVFALSLMILTLTGMPLFYPDVAWAPAIMKALGGPQVAGVIHRVAAVVFAGVFFWHLIYIAIRVGRNWSNFKIFGPESLVPNLKDLQDMIGMFKWFFGKGPRPKFDRWTYWEKFDYWAPFWGVTIIGVSGLIMWLPGLFGSFLPGWVFNVAAIFHGEEAFLAVVFLFTVHFFNNHFRPDKFPIDIVMFTGTFPLEDFKREHAVEYQRLVESGELEKHLVDAPSALKVNLSKLLGFTLIAIGLMLLTLVGIGFFTGG